MYETIRCKSAFLLCFRFEDVLSSSDFAKVLPSLEAQTLFRTIQNAISFGLPARNSVPQGMRCMLIRNDIRFLCICT